MRISDWSSDVCSSDLHRSRSPPGRRSCKGMGKNDEIHRSPDQSPGERVGSPRPVRPLLRVRRLPLGRGSADQRPRYLLRLQSGRLVQPVLLLMEQATEAQAEKAIAVLKRAIDAAENSNQAGENFVVGAANWRPLQDARTTNTARQ